MLRLEATRYMSKIAIIGLGNWGTALAHCWANDSHKVIGWTVEEEVYGSIMETGENAKYLPGMQLDIDVTMDIGEAIEASELIVLSLPSGVILSVVEEIVPHLRPSHVILDLAKAVAPGSQIEFRGIRPGEKLHEVLVSEDESHHTLEHEKFYVITPLHSWWRSGNWQSGQPVPTGFRFSSDANTQWLSVDDLRALADDITQDL